MFLAIAQIEAHHFFFISIKVLYLIGDQSDRNFSEIDKEVVLVRMLVDEEIHVVVLEDTVEIDFLYFVVGNFAISWEIVFLSHVMNVSLDEVIQFLFVLAKNIKTVLHFRKQKFWYLDVDFINQNL